jgi:hypothetical protein
MVKKDNKTGRDESVCGSNHFEFRLEVLCTMTENYVTDIVHTKHAVTSNGYVVPLLFRLPARGIVRWLRYKVITARDSILHYVIPNTTGSHNSRATLYFKTGYDSVRIPSSHKINPPPPPPFR